MSQDNFDKLSSGDSDPQSRTQLLPRVRQDVEISEQVYYGKPCYVLKDPATMRYYRLRPPEYAIHQMLDGQNTMEDVLRVLAQRFPAEQFDAQAVMNFIIMLRSASLLEVVGQGSSDFLLQRKKNMTRGFIKKIRTEFLFFRIPLLDPDRVLNWLGHRLGGLIFSQFVTYLAWFVFAGAIVLALANVDKLAQRQPLLSWINILFYVVPSLALIKVIHEFGHGLTAKHFDCEVHEMGILFLVFMPCAYCDVSDAWMISEKRKRMWITAAGIVVEMMLASLAAYIWALTEPRTVINQLALNIMLVASINSILFNGNPLLRFDGYYFLMDLIEIPNLKQKGSSYLWYLMQRYVLGAADATKPIDAQGRELTVAGYAVCSAIYRWFIMLAIVTMIWRFLDPYGWGVIGGIMALGCLYNALIAPLVKFTKFVFTQRHRLHVRAATAVILAVLILGGLYLLLGLEIEQSVDTQCVLRPARLHPIYVTQAGFIKPPDRGPLVQDGQPVKAGQVLLQLTDPKLEHEARELHLELNHLQELLNQARRTAPAGAGLALVRQLEARIKGVNAQYQRARSNLDKLTISAPFDGILLLRTDRPLRNLVGSFLPVGTAVLSVYEPGSFEAVAAVNHRDNGKIEPNQLAEIRLWSFDNEVFSGVVLHKPPEPVRRMSSAAFSTAFGGEISTMPAANEQEALEPADITYELSLPIDSNDPRLRDGMVGRAKIIVEQKSLGRTFYLWLIRTLRQDIRL